MEVLVSPPFFTVRVCVHVQTLQGFFWLVFVFWVLFSPSLSPVSTLSPQDILNSGLQRLFLSWLLHPFLVGFQCTNQNPHKLLGTCETRNKVLISAPDFPTAFIANEYFLPCVWVVGIFLSGRIVLISAAWDNSSLPFLLVPKATGFDLSSFLYI